MNETYREHPGAATGGVRRLLRVEAIAIMLAAASGYFLIGGNPWLFALIFIVPDLSFAAYAFGPKVGAALYNAIHTYILPCALGAVGVLLGIEILWQIALAFSAHIAFDRTLGYGLKYASAFGHTHLGTIGRRQPVKTSP